MAAGDSATDLGELLEAFDDTSCTWCDHDSFSRSEYKGAPAIRCDDCGVPAVRLV